MHRWLSVLLILLAAAVVLLGARQWRQAATVDKDDGIYLLVLENPRLADAGRQVLAAYASVLDEEGIPWRRLNQFHLLDIAPARLAARCPGLIFPEQVCATGLTPLTHWLHAYLQAGGHVLLIHDVGSRDEEGIWRTNQGLRELLDLAITADDPGDRRRFGRGTVRFLSPGAIRDFGVPPGKLNAQQQLVGYGFGALDYPLAIARPAAMGDGFVVLAWGENAEGLGGPVILARDRGEGSLLFVGLPLGHLKGQADDLPLRLVLRHFADRRARLPRVLPAPRGIGHLVINWHVDANPDHAALPRMAELGFLDPDLPASWHVTAGPDNYEPGDGLGFDACGQGRSLLAMLPASHAIGSHGGWAHNYFALRLAAGELSAAEQRALIVENRDCLALLAGQPVREYSSPAGVHPQPRLTQLIEELGFSSYYYTGDGGSAPNRTFYEGRQVCARAIAFPVLPMGGGASLGELVKNPQITADDLAVCLASAARYCAQERTVRLLYAHPYDLFEAERSPAFRAAWLAWQRELREAQEAGTLRVRTMGEIRDFLVRCWQTEAIYRRTADGLHVSLSNPGGLRDITVAVPCAGLQAPAAPRVLVTADAERFYLTIEDAGHALDLLLPAR